MSQHRARNTGCPRARGDVLGVPLHDELILHDRPTGRTYVLNASGARVWALCDGSRSVTSLAGEVAQQYGVGCRQAAADIQELLDELERADLVGWS